MTDDLLALHQGKVMTDNRAEQLIFGPGGIMEMKQTIADKETEIERLKAKCDIQATILRRLTPENHPDILFIHGTLGNKDQNGMPEKLLVVPAFGVDFSYIYQRTEKTTGPEW
jgi:hypothetical protein